MTRAFTLLVLLALAASGCASAVALDRAVLAYDTTTADSVSKQLLLNIARARHNEPMHFTAISNIAATYRLNMAAGLGPAATGDLGSRLVPALGVAVEESPTISIAPMQGEEFTQRLLTPFSEERFTLLLRQGYDVDALIRLLGAEVRLGRADAPDVQVHSNRPADADGYRLFRRFVAHLSSVQDRHALFVDALNLQHVWTVPATEVTPESFLATYHDFSLSPLHDDYSVSKRVSGRVVITNYNPATLGNAERVLLNDEASLASMNDVLVDIRAGFPGGEWPIHGFLRLRSFHEVLTFVARGMVEEPEFDVAPDPRTPRIAENPAHTLEVVETRSLPPGVRLSVGYDGRQYAVRPQSGYAWNQKAFSLLYQLFQMSVSAVAPAGPSIAIVK